MLKSLEVKDYALIEHINVQFGQGLNIITGETGAGKSILIDAMSLLLGERASTEVIRKGAVKSVVEGIFEASANKKVEALLSENDVEFFPELIVRREISLKGANRCFINDTPVPLNLVKEIGNFLVDLHGQHEHQSLLRTEMHIEFLDEFGAVANLLDEYKTYYTELNKKLNELKELRAKELSLKEKKELYSFQIKEIDAVSPEEGEEQRLIEELNILENAEKLLESTTNIYQTLYDSETSVYDSLVKIKNEIETLLKIDKTFNETSAECTTALTLLNDIADFIRGYNSKIDLDPQNLEEMRQRLGVLNLLKKKYGGSITKIIEYRKKIGDEFEIASNYAGTINNIENEILQLKINCGKAAEKLSHKRKETAKIISREVKEVLADLGIPDALFEVKILNIPADKTGQHFIIVKDKNYTYGSSGFDDVEFFISTNIGEETKPLAKVASGGEVSRIMLSLKTILAKNDKLPLLIFDEIDTGVSGRVAQKVGHALKALASYHQIIAITHLPQIAGLADIHFMVEKSNVDDRVVSHIDKLTGEQRVHEVAKLMSGEIITEASLNGARELMNLK
ncbi:MAG: DNA repair protein RecN [Ignavibacteriaceae bacterium]|nr:DNA repair protein RecN [Ignavibacteriaceae bacterium]